MTHIVLLPGWGYGKDVWQPLTNKLKNNATLQFIDWTNIQSEEQITKRVERVLQRAEKKQQRVTIIGWSLGTLVALHMATRFSKTVNRLILFSATSCFTKKNDYPHGWDRRVLKRMQRRLQTDAHSLFHQFHEQLFSNHEKKIPLLKDQSSQVKDTVTSYKSGLEFLKQADYRKKLQQISQPTLLIHGSDDNICPLGAATYIAENMPTNATLKVINHAGHLPFYTETNTCYEWVKAFIHDQPTHDPIDALEGDCQ